MLIECFTGLMVLGLSVALLLHSVTAGRASAAIRLGHEAHFRAVETAAALLENPDIALTQVGALASDSQTSVRVECTRFSADTPYALRRCIIEASSDQCDSPTRVDHRQWRRVTDAG